MPLLSDLLPRVVDGVLHHIGAWEERLQDLGAVPFSGFTGPLALVNEWAGANPRVSRIDGVPEHG